MALSRGEGTETNYLTVIGPWMQMALRSFHDLMPGSSLLLLQPLAAEGNVGGALGFSLQLLASQQYSQNEDLVLRHPHGHACTSLDRLSRCHCFPSIDSSLLILKLSKNPIICIDHLDTYKLPTWVPKVDVVECASGTYGGPIQHNKTDQSGTQTANSIYYKRTIYFPELEITVRHL